MCTGSQPTSERNTSNFLFIVSGIKTQVSSTPKRIYLHCSTLVDLLIISIWESKIGLYLFYMLATDLQCFFFVCLFFSFFFLEWNTSIRSKHDYTKLNNHRVRKFLFHRCSTNVSLVLADWKSHDNWKF